MLLIHIVLIIGCLSEQTWAAAEEDRITSVPGLSATLAYKQYSGYLRATGDKRLHYWFAESQHSPARDPVVLWLNGGPGCSSLDGFLYELGPLHVHDDGRTVYTNNNTWNLISNLLFLESPAGVGFSYSNSKNYTFDDDIAAEDNYAALKNFFQKFPEFRGNDFYVTGESYGGIYVPTLSLLVSRDDGIKLKGFAVGNGMSSFYLNSQSLPYFAYYHALIDKTLWETLLSQCCRGPRDVDCNFYNNTGSTGAACRTAVGELQQVMYATGLNEYGLYTDCAGSRRRYRALATRTLLGAEGTVPASWDGGPLLEPAVAVRLDPPCVNVTAVSHWLNQAAVRRALHIPGGVQPWEVCSDVVSSKYKIIYRDMTSFYNQLVPSSGGESAASGSKSGPGGGKSDPTPLKALVYNGDTDMACNFLMGEWFVDSLNHKVKQKWRPWHLNGQITGFTKLYDNLRFVTIKGAGHMVPQWKPGPALKMISSFLFDKPLD